MRSDVPDNLLALASQWDELHRWERSELGKALRRLGLTYGEIREIIPVPKGTLSAWSRDIKLTVEQVQAIRERGYSHAGVPRDTQRGRRQEIRALREVARHSAPALAREPLFVAGVALY